MRKTGRWLRSAVIVGTFVCMPLPDRAQTNEANARAQLFTDALIGDGCAVTPGAVTIFNLAQNWCDGTPGVEHAWYTNKAPTSGC